MRVAAAAATAPLRLLAPVRPHPHALPALPSQYIKSTNFGYRTALREERVEYINAAARVAGPHAVEYVDPKSKERRTVTARHIVVAVGGRPRYPDGVEGAVELGITR